ncbi:MAG: nucleotide exchange factor GrpE [Bacteroidetes bacterium]|nr:nucleotide exchange factor GrpE [Bacteroidota bacterium]
MLKKFRRMTEKDNAANPQPEELIDQTEQTTTEDGGDAQNGQEDMQVSENQDDSTELRQQLEELKDKYMRMYAEFDNYKRRAVREKLDWMKSAAQDTVSALLPVLDDFDRAKKFAEGQQESGWSDGVELVYQKIYSVLRQKGVEPMESNGEPFDPELHEAITEIPAPTEDLKGKVVDTLEKGYRLNDKIIRHAKVVVGK